MKNLKIFSLMFFFSAFVTVCFADDQLITQPIKVHVKSPGNLRNQIGPTKAKLITDLTLTGDLNASDLDYLSHMAHPLVISVVEEICNISIFLIPISRKVEYIILMKIRTAIME